MAQTIDGITADFQNGGWYSGRQYWNGQLGAPGVIINPTQVGAGQPVSSEVNKQSDAAQGLPSGTIDKYIADQSAKYYGASGPPPTSPDGVTPYLNNFQSGLYGSGGDIATRMGEIKTLLNPTNPMPAPLNRLETFQQFRTDMGVADLEKSLTDLNAQKASYQSGLRQQTAAEMGKPVATNVIAGRVGEAERAANERIAAVDLQINTVTGELNTKYNLINTYMNLVGLDYQDAVNRYDKEFSQNLQIYNMVTAEQDKAQANARANLTTYANLITSGNMTYSQLSPDQKITLNKLEVQAGLPVGFISSLKMDPKANMLFTNTSNGVTQVGFRNPDGSVSVQSYGTSTNTSGNGGTTVSLTQARSLMEQKLRELGGSDGIVSGAQWQQQKDAWTGAGFTPAEFDKNFASHVNTDWDTYNLTH